jgi:hypothetical protein
MSGESFFRLKIQRFPAVRLRNILVACMLCLSITIYAQNNNQDLLILNSGTELKGTITDTSSSSGISILLEDSARRWVSRLLIDSIALSGPLPTQPTETPGVDDQDMGDELSVYQIIFEIGLNAVTNSPENSEENYPNQFAFNFVNGLAFRNQISAGIGFGLRTLGNDSPELFPLFIDARFGLLDRTVSPTINGGIGLALKFEGKWNSAGSMFFINGGLRIRLNQYSALMLTVGYEQLPLPANVDLSISNLRADDQFTKAVSIKAGVAF